MKFVALGLGSNKGFENLKPEEILFGAVSALGRILSDIRISSVYRTKAMYVENQDDFLNMVVIGAVDDTMSAGALLGEVHKIEASFGRARQNEIRFGPRSLDIDIEFFGTERISTCDLEVPHPRLCERKFVLLPLLEILPNPADDINGEIFSLSVKTLASCLAGLGGAGCDVEKVVPKEDFFCSGGKRWKERLTKSV